MKTDTDVAGLEYDWLAVDRDGHVALFSTAGGGYAPREFLRDTAAHDAAIATILEGMPTTTARFAPELAPGLSNTWRKVAERGLFAFDSHPNGGPYTLVAAPSVPRRLGDLPVDLNAAVSQVCLRDLAFASVSLVSEADIQRNETTASETSSAG